MIEIDQEVFDALATARRKLTDSTHPDFRPWWGLASLEELREGIWRNQRAVRFCKGRAADFRQHVLNHIEFLSELLRGRVQ